MACIRSLVAPHKKVFGEKYDRAWRSSKTVKIEGYNSHFYTSMGLVHEYRGMARGDMGCYIKRSHGFE